MMTTFARFFGLALLVGLVSLQALSHEEGLPAVERLAPCVPGNETTPMPKTATEYAEMCKPHLGVMPTIDCGDGVRIPSRVGGQEVFFDPSTDQCDDTGFQESCYPGSRVGRVQGASEQGVPLEDVVWLYFCRSVGKKNFEQGIVSVQVIGYNNETGATCFFESPDGVGSLKQKEYLAWDERGLLDGELPGPDHPEFNDAWIPPPKGVQCVQCHQNDPFIHNPWIDAATLPSDPRQPVVPQAAGPNSPYWVVGGSDWDMRTVHVEGNRCVSCHRAPMATAELFEHSGIEVSDFMPPGRPGSGASEYEQLMDCHLNGAGDTPGCSWVIPPGGGCEGGEVGEDYPYATTKKTTFETKRACEEGVVAAKNDTTWECRDGAWHQIE